MAYVRTHGNQVSIVQGERHPESGKVEQRVLFTFYSKAEAHEALGQGSERGDRVFLSLLQHHHPTIRFDEDKLKRELAAHLDALPDLYDYRSAKLRDQFRSDLVTFARQLLLCDPQTLLSSADLVREHRLELTYLAELIRWRLSVCEQDASEWNRDNPYLWRYRMQGSSIPPEAMDEISELYDKGEHERVQALARLYIDCFPDYAEGHNYLGLVARGRGQLDEAEACFRRAIEVGRTLFPRRMPKDHYWLDHATRPYLRGLSYLIITLNRAGRYEEALTLCERMDDERGERESTLSLRMDILLNMGRWAEARAAALYGLELWPEQAFRVALAHVEANEREEALYWFLYGAVHRPRTAWWIAGRKAARPKSWEQVTDHNAAVELMANLRAALRREAKTIKSLLAPALSEPEVAALMQEIDLGSQVADTTQGERAATKSRPSESWLREKAQALLGLKVSR